MKLIKTQDLNDVKVKDIKKFIKKVYKLCNGKINPIYPSEYLEFYRKPDVEFMNEPENKEMRLLGQHIYDHVAFNPYEMKAWALANSMLADIYEFKSLIIGIVLHELSHMDQNYKLFGKNDFTSKYPCKNSLECEVANDFNVYEFMRRHYEFLVKHFGRFDLEAYFSISAYNPEDTKDNAFYGKISDIRVRTLEMMSIISGLNFFDLIHSDFVNDITYIRIVIYKNKKPNSVSVTFPLVNLLKPVDQYLIEDIKEINSFIVRHALQHVKADVLISIEEMDEGSKILTINVEEYSRSFTVLKDSTSFDGKLCVYKDDKFGKQVKDIIKAYRL